MDEIKTINKNAGIVKRMIGLIASPSAAKRDWPRDIRNSKYSPRVRNRQWRGLVQNFLNK